MVEGQARGTGAYQTDQGPEQSEGRVSAAPPGIGEGEEIRGTFSLRPSSESPRGVDIDLEVHVDKSRRGATRMSRTYQLR